MERFDLADGRSVTLLQGDLTQQDVDAIVNAANQLMLGGGGVDGAIHRAAGPRLLAACWKVPTVRLMVRCPTGEARITPGFNLKARHVIHTVGPKFRSHEESAPLLASAVRNSLALARENGLHSVAFPAISCGVYGYAHADASRVALETVRDDGQGIEDVRFVLFGASDLEIWLEAAREVFDDSR